MGGKVAGRSSGHGLTFEGVGQFAEVAGKWRQEGCWSPIMHPGITLRRPQGRLKPRTG